MGLDPSIPLRGKTMAPNFMGMAQDYMTMSNMVQQRRKKSRMQDIAKNSIDQSTGRMDPMTFIKGVSREFPQEGQQMYNAFKSQQEQAKKARRQALKTNVETLKTRNEAKAKSIENSRNMLDIVTPENWQETLYKINPDLLEKFPVYTDQTKRALQTQMMGFKNKLKQEERQAGTKLELDARAYINTPQIQNLMANAHSDVESYNKLSKEIISSPFAETKAAKTLLKRTRTKGSDLFEALAARQDARLETFKKQETFKKGQKQEEMASAIPGWEGMKGIDLTNTAVKEAHTAVVKTNVIEKLLDDLITKYDKEGVTVVPGEVQADMESTVTDIQMELKELNNLGVLAGPDMGLLLSQLPDPTSMGAALKKGVGTLFGKGDPIGSKFNTFKNNLKRKLNSKMGSYGFQRKSTQQKSTKPSKLSDAEWKELKELEAKYGKQR